MRLFGWLRKPLTCDWIHVRILIEPGISDVDYGRWSRKMIKCARCGARRRVWQGLGLNDPGLRGELCPSEDMEAEYEQEVNRGSHQR